MLQRLLRQLEDQDDRTPRFDIVVVDNDSAQSAKQSVTAFAEQSRLAITYLNQPAQNISLARNQAIHAASAVWLAMIDDDEWPTAQWLWRFHETAQQYGVDIVLGPVMPDLPDDTVPWIREGGFFERPRYPTGSSVPYMEVRTSNLFIRRDTALVLPGPFDPNYGLTGGEDVMMLEQLRMRGHRIIWCDEAAVIEAVPKNRRSLRWILRRAYGGAQNYARVHRALGGTALARWARSVDSTVRGLVFLPAALLFCLCWRPFDRRRSIRWLQKAAMQVGKLSAVFRLRHQAYATNPGHDAATTKRH